MKEKLSDYIESKSNKFPDDQGIILANAIMDDNLLGYIFTKYKNKQIKIKHFSKYAQFILRWIIHYYSKYEKAPRQHIEDIFRENKKVLGKGLSDSIELVLNDLNKFNNNDEINIDYIKEEVIARFIKRKEAKRLINEIQNKIDFDNLEKLDNAIESYTKITKDEDIELGTITPGSVETVKKYYMTEKDKNAMYILPGPIGNLIGPIYRGKTYAITAVEKNGKTYFMQDMAYYGMLHSKLKVLDINLEMPEEDKNERFWQRITKMAIDEEHAGKILSPIFDCENNQYGSCNVRKTKLNNENLLRDNDSIVTFEERRDWKICQKCRNKKIRKNAHRTKRFIPAIWYKENNIRIINEKKITKKIKDLEINGIYNYKIKCFPRFSATLDEIITYIKQYISNKNFHPDIIILDYPDITAPFEGKVMDRLAIDYNWKRIVGLGQELNVAIFVADQATKAERMKRSLTNMCTSEAKTKDAHIDVRIGLNSSEIERDLGLQRVNMLFKRKGRLCHTEVMITQRLETGNVLLDSVWWYKRNLNYQCLKAK